MVDVFEYYVNASKLYEKIVMPLCEKHNLTYMEFSVLMFLANNPECDTQSEIVKYRNVTKSHVSISVRALEEKGYISKSYNGENRKKIHLKVEILAKPVVDEGKKLQSQYKNILTKGLSDDEFKNYKKVLSKLDENVKKSLGK